MKTKRKFDSCCQIAPLSENQASQLKCAKIKFTCNNEQAFEEGWSVHCKEGIRKARAILRSNSREAAQESRPKILTNAEFILLYSIGSELTEAARNKYSLRLYHRVMGEFNQYVLEDAAELSQCKESFLFLTALRSIWQRNSDLIEWIANVFRSLDSFVVGERYASISSCGLLALKEYIFDKFKAQFIDALLDATERARGETEMSPEDILVLRDNISLFQISSGIVALPNLRSVQELREQLFLPLDLYEEDFEVKYLQQVRNFYSKNVTEWKKETCCQNCVRQNDGNANEYFAWVRAQHDREVDRARLLMNPSTAPKAGNTCLEECLLSDDAFVAECLARPSMLMGQQYSNEGGLSSTSELAVEICSEWGHAVVLLETLLWYRSDQDAQDLLEESHSYFTANAGHSGSPRQFLLQIEKALAQAVDRLLCDHVAGELNEKMRFLCVRNSSSEDKSSILLTLKLLLYCRELFEYILTTVLKSHARFRFIIRRSFSGFLNDTLNDVRRPGFIADMLVLQIDEAVKTQDQNPAKEEVEDRSQLERLIDTVVEIFVDLTDKDLFLEKFKASLSRRLLSNKSAISEIDTRFISGMKKICGASFTAAVEGMMFDLTLSTDLNKEFQSKFSRGNRRKCPKIPANVMSVQVVTASHWSIYQQGQLRVNLPPCLENPWKQFQHWYAEKFAMRRLKLVPVLGEVVISARYGSTKYEIAMTTLQASVLLIAEDLLKLSSSVSFTELEDKLALGNTIILKKVLHSLACHKHNILLRELTEMVSPSSLSPSGNERSAISTSDRFRLNPSFSSAVQKFRLPAPVLEKQFIAEIEKVVEVNRSFSIDAAIIKVMKARKTLSQAQLILELRQQIGSFQPDMRTIKQRIEALIDREYLRRDLTDSSVFAYLP